MITRITITLSEEERESLRQLAEREIRGLKDHIRYILRQEVKRCSASSLVPQTRNEPETMN
jgi:hypothetical protein